MAWQVARQSNCSSLTRLQNAVRVLEELGMKEAYESIADFTENQPGDAKDIYFDWFVARMTWWSL